MENILNNMDAGNWITFFTPVFKKSVEVIWVSNITYITSKVLFSSIGDSITSLIENRFYSSFKNKVLFFPEDVTFKCTCRPNHNRKHLKTACKCGGVSDSETAFGSLLDILNKANKSLDICMFVLTSSILGNIVVNLHRRGVVVRVVTDNEKMELNNSQIMNFRAEGIQVRCDKSSFLMHNKFAIVDNETLLTGSFNWTVQANTGNKENLLTTNYPPLVKPYINEFERLWIEYDREQAIKA